MKQGSVIYAHCGLCEEETPHRILKGTMDQSLDEGFSGTVQCQTCKGVHHVEIPADKPCMVPMVLSEGENSRKVKIQFGREEGIITNDEVFFEDHNILITSIESGGKRVKRGLARDISMLWAVVFDTVKVKVAIVKGSTTASEVVEAAPDEEFAVGDLLEFGRKKVMITKIKTTRKMVYREGRPVEARDIRRLYTRIARERVLIETL